MQPKQHSSSRIFWRRRCAQRAAAALLALAAAACAHAGELLLGVSSQSAMALPFYVAEARNLYAAEGLAVRTVPCAGGGRCFEQMLAGAVQMATSSELPVVFNSFMRRDYAIVATVVSSVGNIRLLGRRSAGVVDAASLAGKRIGVLRGTSSHYALETNLQFHGVDPAKVTLVELTIETIADALTSGRVDAIAAYNQQIRPAIKALGADALVLKQQRIYTETMNLIVDRKTLASRREDVVKLLRALERAERFIAEQPEQAKQMLVARTAFNAAVVESIYADYSYRLGLDQSLVAAMEGEARWAVREGHVGAARKVPNYLDFIDEGPLRSAVPSRLFK